MNDQYAVIDVYSDALSWEREIAVGALEERNPEDSDTER